VPVSRREFLIGAGGVAGLSVVGLAGPAFGAARVDPATGARNRLVVIFLDGGNDGLNYVVPRGDVAGAARLSVYRKVRPSLAYAPGKVLPLDRPGDADEMLGFNPQLRHLHQLYRDGRVAVVQGVDYPNHNYSHFTSADIWHTGDPKSGSAGWLGRHIDRAGIGEGELRAVAVGSKVPLMLLGRSPAAAITSIDAMRFRDTSSADAAARHNALAGLNGAYAGDPLRRRVGASLGQAVDVVADLANVQPPPAVTTEIAASLLTARSLLEQNLGVECVYVTQGGYDTHAAQENSQAGLLKDLDAALETFWLGTAGGTAVGTIGAMKPEVAGRTLVMIVSEFGRRIGENGGLGVAGTDHGAAAPVVIIGPPTAARPAGAAALTAGLHGDHPKMGTAAAPADNLVMTTDLRHLYQSVLTSWLGNPDPIYASADATPLKGLFTGAAGTSVGGKDKQATRIGSAVTLDGQPGSLDSSGAATPQRQVRETMRVATRADGDGRHVHPVSVAAALAFNAFVAAVVVRSGRFRAALAEWRDDDTLS
jgi:uncharacterized protein (DUF1501 family)